MKLVDYLLSEDYKLINSLNHFLSKVIEKINSTFVFKSNEINSKSMTLNSAKYYDIIIENLTVLREEIRSKSKIGLLDINKHCEDFVKEILNKVYGYELINLNRETINFPGLDIGDINTGIAFQISSTKTSVKIDNTLEMCLNKKHFDKFPKISIFILTSKQKSYSIKTVTAPHFHFTEKNIIDFDDIYQDILQLDIDKKKDLSEYIERELPYRTVKSIEKKDVFAEYLTRIEGLQTGGNSFCYLMLYHFDLDRNIAQNFCIIKTGEFPLYDVRYRILDMDAHVDILRKTHGELNAPAEFTIVKWGLPEKVYYRIFFSARNGQWNQDLILIKSVKSKCWLAATKVRDKSGANIAHQHIDIGFEVEFGSPNWRQ
jgi:hypothetical protein